MIDVSSSLQRERVTFFIGCRRVVCSCSFSSRWDLGSTRRRVSCYRRSATSQRERVLRWLLPWPEPRLILSRAVVEVLGGLIIANLAVAAVQAVICASGLAIFGLPHVFSLGVLSFFLAFVPVVGTAAVTVSAAIYLLSHGRVGAGLLMLGLALFVGTIDNMLRPFFLRGRVELPVAWIFLSIMGGIAAFGVAGIVLGPVALSICRAALLALEEKEKAQAQVVAQKPAAREAGSKEVR